MAIKQRQLRCHVKDGSTEEGNGIEAVLLFLSDGEEHCMFTL